MFELRIYTIHEGRMNAIRDRFANHTLGIFERLGMKVVDFWMDGAGQPKLYYLMAYADIAERQRQWEQFRQDPEWAEVKRKSEADGGPIVAKIEEYFMDRADFFNPGREQG